MAEYKPAWLQPPTKGLLDLEGKIKERPKPIRRSLAEEIWQNLPSSTNKNPPGSNQAKGKSNG